MWRDAGLAQVGDELGRIEALVSAQRQPSGRSGGMAVDHVQCGAPFRMTVGLRQAALRDQAVAFGARLEPVAARASFQQRVAEVAKHGLGVGGLL